MVAHRMKPAPFPHKYQFWNINSLYTEWARHNGFKSLCETSWGFLRPFLHIAFGAMLKWVITECDGRGLSKGLGRGWESNWGSDRGEQ
jgi:hypothetical protein